MKRLNRIRVKHFKSVLAFLFSFALGCMVAINFAPINKTCRLDDTDREYNIMKNSQLKSPELIVLIISAPKNIIKRSNLRDSWLKLKDNNHWNKHNDQISLFSAKHFFVIGNLGLTPEDVSNLNSEQSKYNDILMLPIHDGYKNLTYKVLSSFVWLNDQLDVGLNFKYVLKCDDDSFVRLDKLLHETKHIETMYLKSDLIKSNIINDNSSPFIQINAQVNKKSHTNNLELYWGYFAGNAQIKTFGKWKQDNWIFCDTYLPYALGGGYILSKNLVSFLAKSFDNLRLFNSEDVSVGVWLSPINNILRIHDRRFDTEWTSRGCQNHHLISHNLTIEEIQRMYLNVVATGNLCGHELAKRPSYLYNWSNPSSKCCSRKQM